MALKRVFVALSGASGAVYGLRLVEQLWLNGIEVIFTASCSGTLVCREETGLDLSGKPTDWNDYHRLTGATLARRAA